LPSLSSINKYVEGDCKSNTRAEQHPDQLQTHSQKTSLKKRSFYSMTCSNSWRTGRAQLLAPTVWPSRSLKAMALSAAHLREPLRLTLEFGLIRDQHFRGRACVPAKSSGAMTWRMIRG